LVRFLMASLSSGVNSYLSNPFGCILFMGVVSILIEVFKVTQRDQIVGHNVFDSPEQCSGEQTIFS
jgi:hypothetical protein